MTMIMVVMMMVVMMVVMMITMKIISSETTRMDHARLSSRESLLLASYSLLQKFM